MWEREAGCIVGNGRKEQQKLSVVLGIRVPGLSYLATERVVTDYAASVDAGCKY